VAFTGVLGSLASTASSVVPAFGALTMGAQECTVEIAFDSGYLTPAVSRTWTDVSEYVEADRGLSIQRGRPDQFSTVQPSRLSLTLDNTDGRFTPEYASGAYYPDVKKGRPIRVRLDLLGLILFTGYVDEWPVEWPGGSEAMSTVTVTASSRMQRLGRSTELRSIIEEILSADAPTLYFPLGEPTNSTTAGNIAPGRSDVLSTTQVGTGGTLAFGAGTGPGTDDLTAPTFTPVDTLNGKVLSTTLVDPLMPTGTTTLEFECFVNTTSSLGRPIVIGDNPSTSGLGLFPYVSLNVNASGLAQVWFNGTVGGVDLVVAGADINDGATHHLAGRLVISGGTATVSLMVDGAARVSNSAAYTDALPGFRTVVVGGGLASDVFDGTIAHVSIRSGTTATTDARIVEHYSAGITGFSGEASGARIERYATLAGIPTAEVSAETGLSTSIAHKDTTGESALSLMEAVAETEDGVVFDAGDGTLTFHARSHRYTATSSFTLDCEAGDVETGYLPRLDDQHLTNDMTASRPEGVKIRSTNDDSISEYGYYRQSKEILTTSDNEVQARADWQVNRFGTPRVTVPDVAVELTASDPSLAATILAAEIGTRFTVDNLPTQAPASSADYFVEAISDDIGVNSWRRSFTTSPAEYANVWILDSATQSQLDSTTVLAY
jgi:hypothetical protein